MKQKVYFAGKFSFRRFIMISLLIALLVLFVILKSTYDNILYDIGMYVFIVINALVLIMLYSVIKTRIEINPNELFAPFYIWYDDFSVDLDETPMIKSIYYKSIKSIELIEVDTVLSTHKVSAIKIEMNVKYDLCLLLDSYSEKEVKDIFELITYYMSLVHQS